MHHLTRFFSPSHNHHHHHHNSNHKQEEEEGGGGIDIDHHHHKNKMSSRSKPKLERRNAHKNINYEASSSLPSSATAAIAAASASSSPFSYLDQASLLTTRSLDLPSNTSFRIGGIDGEIDRLCISLGLSGPDDFAIPTAAWEARKAKSTSQLLPKPLLLHQSDVEITTPTTPPPPAAALDDGDDSRFRTRVSPPPAAAVLDGDDDSRFRTRVSPPAAAVLDDGDDDSRFGTRVSPPAAAVLDGDDDSRFGTRVYRNSANDGSSSSSTSGGGGGGGGARARGRGGINGVRPPVLAPPPSMSVPVLDHSGSTWDLVRDFAPKNNTNCTSSSSRKDHIQASSSDEENDDVSDEEEGDEEIGDEIVDREDVDEGRSDEAAVNSDFHALFSSSNDDDSSSTTTEQNIISPDGKLRRNIRNWTRGTVLGSGSFGTVYEALSDDGVFIAVKEVSLLDQGGLGRQSIDQLDQEIALLSQFEHENIVRYLGTDKDDAKLYIFLELVTKGSLAQLYQNYHLKDSQVSAYTRQILHGLKYLHDRNVVHRDIKCANILVHTDGSVKLADFGLAKTTKLNDVKSCKGTAFWMAPEVVKRRNQGYGLAADIWSLGCTVLEMLTRRLPYHPLEGMQAVFRIGRGEPPNIPGTLSGDAQDFIRQCLQIKPDNRPTAAKLLEHAFVKRPVSSGSDSPFHYNWRQS